MRRRLLPAVLAAATAVLLPATPSAAAPAVDKSDNVSYLGTVAQRGVVSVRSKGNHMFVSTVTGLIVLDISDPRAPRRVGKLDMPLAQNEDVDIGGDILLLSDEPGVGAGVLHVIDISDPTNPREIASYNTWAPGVITDLFGLDDTRPTRGGIGHTATCVQQCRYAYLAGSDAGIDIVDLRDPRVPRFAGRFAARAAAYGIGTHDVQIDGAGLAWVAGGGGTAAYDVSDPAKPRLVHRTDRSARGPSLQQVVQGNVGDGNRRNDLLHHNSQRLPMGSLAGAPTGVDPATPSDVVAITEEDLYRPGCKGAGTLETWRIGRGGVLRHLDSWRTERNRNAQLLCSAHYFEDNGGIVAQGWFEQGVRFLDVRRPERIQQVGYWAPDRGVMWGAVYPPTDPTGSTVYAIDHRRGIDVLGLDRSNLRPVKRVVRRRVARKPNVAIFVDDGREEVRAGQRLTLQVDVFNSGAAPLRGVAAQIILPREVDELRSPGRQRLSARKASGGRTVLTFRQGELARDTRRRVRVRVKPGTRPGRLIFEGRVTAQQDATALDDRWVDRDQVVSALRGDGATSRSARRYRFYCPILPRDRAGGF